MYAQLAKATQDLLQTASVPAGKQNARILAGIHDMLDGIQTGRLVIGAPVKDPEPAKE